MEVACQAGESESLACLARQHLSLHLPPAAPRQPYRVSQGLFGRSARRGTAGGGEKVPLLLTERM